MLIMRPNKTQKDRASGASARNASNKDQRAAWSSQLRNAGGSLTMPFPYLVCNGKKNRTRVTGKNNTVVLLK